MDAVTVVVDVVVVVDDVVVVVVDDVVVVVVDVAAASVVVVVCTSLFNSKASECDKTFTPTFPFFSPSSLASREAKVSPLLASEAACDVIALTSSGGAVLTSQTLLPISSSFDGNRISLARTT